MAEMFISGFFLIAVPFVTTPNRVPRILTVRAFRVWTLNNIVSKNSIRRLLF